MEYFFTQMLSVFEDFWNTCKTVVILSLTIILSKWIDMVAKAKLPNGPKSVLHLCRLLIQIILGMENNYVSSMSASCVHVCVISVMVGSRLPICWFLVGLLLFYAVVVCHLYWHCQVFLARAYDWISKSSLASLLSLTVLSTHTHTHLYAVKSKF